MIKLLLTDVDGCMTDGTVYYGPNHEKFKKFNMQDGMGIRILHEHNILAGIITSDNSMATKHRAEDLKFDYLQIGVLSKYDGLQKLLKECNINIDEVAYMGDDIQDLEVLNCVGFSCAPSNAVEEVKEQVDYITNKAGGFGAFREFVMKVIELNGGEN